MFEQGNKEENEEEGTGKNVRYREKYTRNRIKRIRIKDG